MRSLVMKAVSGVLIVIAAGQLRAETIWNVADDFSATDNPNGPWSYGISLTLGGSFLIDDTPLSSGLDSWLYQGNGNYAHLAHNGTADTYYEGSGVTLPANGVCLHPGRGGDFAVIRWTAPLAALISIKGGFTGQDTTGGSTDVHVLHNGETSVFDGTVSGYGPGSGPDFSIDLSVSVGDTLDFVVGCGTGSWWDDTTGLVARITAVPEPSTIALVGVGCVALYGFSRLRRQSKLR
ncbi:MAG: PEP-CTERM sorting domain-containing protein [Thermoguttaceae bacterium]